MLVVPRAEHVCALKTQKYVSIERLKKRGDFLRVARAGKKYICHAFILQYAASIDEQTTRFGVTASKKVGNAVKRNLAKRRMRALLHLCNSHVKPGQDYVLIARTAIFEREFTQMQNDLTQALIRIA